MYKISKQDFDKLRKDHPDYVMRSIMKYKHKGKVSPAGSWTMFESLLTHQSGTGLIYEHIHFEIV